MEETNALEAQSEREKLWSDNDIAHKKAVIQKANRHVGYIKQAYLDIDAFRATALDPSQALRPNKPDDASFDAIDTLLSNAIKSRKYLETYDPNAPKTQEYRDMPMFAMAYNLVNDRKAVEDEVGTTPEPQRRAALSAVLDKLLTHATKEDICRTSPDDGCTILHDMVMKRGSLANIIKAVRIAGSDTLDSKDHAGKLPIDYVGERADGYLVVRALTKEPNIATALVKADGFTAKIIHGAAIGSSTQR